MAIALTVAGLLLGLGISSGLLLFGLQRRLLYPAPPWPLPNPLPPELERIDYSHGYGLFLNAAQHPHDARPVMIAAHGNGETAFARSAAFGEILAAGISVLLIEYPGYGGADGHPSYRSIQATMLVGYDQLLTRSDVDARAIVAYGRSMGGAAACLLAAHRSLAALCLESTFSCLSRLLWEKHLPGVLLRDRYDNSAILRQLTIPVLIYHGTEDELIPVHHAYALAHASSCATLITGPFTHSNCPRPWTDLLQFLAEQTAVPQRSNPEV